MFGKRSAAEALNIETATPPPPSPGQGIATRPQRVEASPAPAAPVQRRPAGAAAQAGAKAAGPRPTSAFEQLRAVRGPAAETEVVAEQSDYYQATKTTIFNALLNTIDLSQLGQLDAEAAGRAKSATSSPSWWRSRTSPCRCPSRNTWSRTSSTTCSASGRWSRFWPATRSPTSWSTAPSGCSSKSAGKVQLTNVRFRDNTQLMNICQRIVSQVGRRVDESPRRSATRASPTARGSTSSPRLWRWTARH